MTLMHIRVLAGTLGRALKLVWRSAPRLALAQALLAIAQALLPLITLFALKRAIDAATDIVRELPAIQGTETGSLSAMLHHPSGQMVALWLVIGAVAIGINACLRALAAWVGEQHAMAVSDHIHCGLHEKMLAVDLAFFENSDAQNRLHLAQSEAMTRPIHVMDSLFQILQGSVGFLSVVALLVSLQPLIALVLVLASLPAVFFRLHRGQRLYEWRRDLAPLEREAGYFHHLLTTGETAKELRLQGHGAFCRERFVAIRNRLRDARLVWRRYVLISELGMQFAMLTITAVILLWMSGQLLVGLTLGALVMYVQAVQRGQGQLSLLASAIASLYQSALFLQAFDELMGLPACVKAPPSPRDVPAPLRQGIVFDHVSFTYPGTDQAVLQDLSFTLHPNERVALVGANGAGKSTLVKLLCRLYDPTQGRILVDGVNLRELDPVAWRQRLGVLFQDFGRYQLTAGENIWIGDPRGSSTDARVAAAAHHAGVDKIVESWPQGLSTPLGRWLREGMEPSMGQWQRIALARVLIRDAEFLIMDEPTSALDAHTQSEVVHLLQTATEGRMALVISHRPEILAWTDRAIVLSHGTVVKEEPIR